MFSINFSDVSSDFEDSEAEEEDDAGVAGPPGRYSVIINWWYQNCAILLYHAYIFLEVKAYTYTYTYTLLIRKGSNHRADIK